MMNLLAILLSLAMLITGTPGEAPAGRMFSIGNLTVHKNDQEMVLNPYVSLGVTTDGQQAIYDFQISLNDASYFPFQASVTQDSLLMRFDKDGQTLVITREDLEGLMGGMGFPATGDFQPGDLIAAYSELMAVMRDYEGMEKIRKNAWEIYDQVVERGEPTDGEVEYEGDRYQVKEYQYTLTGAQIGKLADQVYACDERLKRYYDAYFNLVKQAPEGAGFTPAESFEALFAQFDISMDVDESISDEGLVIMNATLNITPPLEGQLPMAFILQQQRFEEREYATVSFNIEQGGMDCEAYVEYSRDGRDFNSSFNLTGNPPAQETSGGEGDSEDMLYVTADYDSAWDEDTHVSDINADLTVSYVPANLDLNIDLKSQPDQEGLGLSHISGELTLGEDTYAVEFDAAVTGDTVERRVTAEGALPMDQFSLPALLQNLAQEGTQLMADKDVQALVALFTAAMPAPEASTEDTADEPASDRPYANPVFDWLPEGFEVDEINVDPQYDDVSCTLLNRETGHTITVDLTESYNQDNVRYYTVLDEGFNDLRGLLVTEEDFGDYCMYTADDGKISYTLYPDSKDTPETDILNILIGLHFS